jgi:hypothetical protein
VKNPKYKIGDFVRFFCKYKNENVTGEIIHIRQANLNWDYEVRYQIHTDLDYIQWVAEEYIIDKVKK